MRRARVWKILRDTDGERFVVHNKVSAFSGEFARCKTRNSVTNWSAAIENSLDAIIYPLALELFALQKNRHALSKRSFSDQVKYGPPEIELGVAKKISITIMRLPRWKRLIAKSEALKSDLIFERVCRLVALINFAMAPRQTCRAFPIQVFVSLLRPEWRSLRQSQAISLLWSGLFANHKLNANLRPGRNS